MDWGFWQPITYTGIMLEYVLLMASMNRTNDYYKETLSKWVYMPTYGHGSTVLKQTWNNVNLSFKMLYQKHIIHLAKSKNWVFSLTALILHSTPVCSSSQLKTPDKPSVCYLPGLLTVERFLRSWGRQDKTNWTNTDNLTRKMTQDEC